MQFQLNVFDVWVFSRKAAEVQYLHYRGLKDGLPSTFEYVTGAAEPALELNCVDGCTHWLRVADRTHARTSGRNEPSIYCV